MADILSTYYTIKNNNYRENKFYSPTRMFNVNQNLTEKNLSPYGIYLAQNNLFLLSKKEKFPKIPKINIDNISNLFNKEESKKDDKDINNNNNKNDLVINKTIKEINDIENKDIILNKERNNKIKKKKEYLKLRNDLINFNDIKDNYFKTDNSIRNTKRNKTYNDNIYKKISNNRYKNYKEKLDNDQKAEKIANEILSLTSINDIKNYYLKKESKNNQKEKENDDSEIKNFFSEANYPLIDPMSYIKYNLVANPRKNDLFKSLDIQLMIMGSEKYRNNLIDGVNDYKSNVLKFAELKGPTGFDKNKIKEKRRKRIIKKMKNHFVEKRGMIFTNQVFKKLKNKKRIFDFEYDENYKNIKKFMNKDIDKYENKININKNITNNVDKKDIKIMNKLDSDAELVIKRNDDMIRFSKKFLSFDEKLKRLYNKTVNTTGYLFKRTKQYHKIKMKIDQLYHIE